MLPSSTSCSSRRSSRNSSSSSAGGGGCSGGSSNSSNSSKKVHICQNLQNWWKFEKVIAKNEAVQFSLTWYILDIIGIVRVLYVTIKL